ncbi:MAG: cytidine/deoxycytidylate deaminase family protein [Parvibaculaceae bacterium]
MNWTDYFMGLARHVATKSKDRSTKVGCIIVGPDNEIRSTGYNSFPRGIDDENEERHQRPLKYKWTEHAERNAIYNAARMGTPLKGCRMYLPWFPCMDCARAVVQSGISQLVCTAPDLDNPTWGDDFRNALVLFEEAGTELQFVSLV